MQLPLDNKVPNGVIIALGGDASEYGTYSHVLLRVVASDRRKHDTYRDCPFNCRDDFKLISLQCLPSPSVLCELQREQVLQINTGVGSWSRTWKRPGGNGRVRTSMVHVVFLTPWRFCGIGSWTSVILEPVSDGFYICRSAGNQVGHHVTNLAVEEDIQHRLDAAVRVDKAGDREEWFCRFPWD